jgi:DNA-binding protein HU-beta
MNKSALVAAIAQKTGASKKDAERMLEAFQDTVTEALQGNEQVTLTGFGSFSVTTRAARMGVNPSTGEQMKIPATNVPKFKAGKALKDAVRK